jgi:DNA-directed RNA polymerase specialized sigma24 family protein
MAATMAGAIEAAEGPAFDAIVGYTVAAPQAAPTDPDIATAFARLDPKELRRLTLALSARERRHPTEADDAIQDAFLDLLVKQREILLDAPGSWLGYLYEVARRRLQEVGGREGALSTDALREAGDDAFLSGAQPCAPESHSAEEQSRHAPPPAPGRFWSREQILGAIQRFRDHHGRPPRATEFRAINGLPSLATLYRHFDSLANALLVAGMTPDSPRRRSWPPLAAARECRAFKRRNGRWPYWRDVKRRPGELPSTTVMIRCFGGTRAVDIQLGAEAILAAVGEPIA